jgi:hypothetical protein
MLDYVKAELRRAIALTQENERISSEYKNTLIRLFVSVAEARVMLEILEEHELGQSQTAC